MALTDLALWLLSPHLPGGQAVEVEGEKGGGKGGQEVEVVGRRSFDLDSDWHLYWAPTVCQATGSVPAFPGLSSPVLT